MNNLDLLLFAAIACFLIFRLFMALGNRDGNESESNHWIERHLTQKDKKNKTIDERADEIVDASDLNETIDITPSDIGQEDHTTPHSKVFATIRKHDPNFNSKTFLEGASVAFEMILDYYCQGDKKNLKPLLSDDVYNGFVEAIDSYEANDQNIEDMLIGLDHAEIVEASITKGYAEIVVAFTSQQIHAIYDKDGTLVSGDSKTVSTSHDRWRFKRSLSSENPNWLMVETDTSN